MNACPWALLLLTSSLVAQGCAQPQPPPSRRAPVLELAPVASQVAVVTSSAPALEVALSLERFDAAGALPVQALVWDDTGEREWEVDHRAEDLAGGPPAPLLLPPGRYRLLVFAQPHPFGFDVLLRPRRPVVVHIQSQRRSHLVLLETHTSDGPRTVVDRQVLGFRWGDVDLEGLRRRHGGQARAALPTAAPPPTGPSGP
ncbi:MAG: hypothetical protein AB7N76_15085 [Planctomycetota bacterium]